jgi:hypothetical protein
MAQAQAEPSYRARAWPQDIESQSCQKLGPSCWDMIPTTATTYINAVSAHFVSCFMASNYKLIHHSDWYISSVKKRTHTLYIYSLHIFWYAVLSPIWICAWISVVMTSCVSLWYCICTTICRDYIVICWLYLYVFVCKYELTVQNAKWDSNMRI